MGSYFRDFYSPKATQRPTVGDTKFSVINQDHMGWLNCDGRGLSTSTYNILFQTVGYSFGGSGDTFNLPDARGRVPGAVGNPEVDSLNPTTYILGDMSGNQLHQLSIPEMPEHNHGTDVSGSVVGDGLTGISGEHIHGITDPGHTHTYTISNDQNEALANINDVSVNKGVTPNTNTGSSSTGITVNSNGNHQHSISTQGGDVPHNNMQPTIFMGNMFIFSGKYGAGFFPYAAGTNIF
jgi:microcystin-dependent protein